MLVLVIFKQSMLRLSNEQRKNYTKRCRIGKHEYKTILFFTELGYDVELIPKSNRAGEHTPDIRMEELLWEIKSPKSEGKYLIANTIQKAVKQSQNIIIDLRRTKRHQSKCLAEIRKEFSKSGSLKRVKIILKSQKLIELSK